MHCINTVLMCAHKYNTQTLPTSEIKEIYDVFHCIFDNGNGITEHLIELIIVLLTCSQYSSNQTAII